MLLTSSRSCYELIKAILVVQVLRLWANLLSCSTCSTSEQPKHDVRHVRRASIANNHARYVRRTSKANNQYFLSIQELGHDSLMNRVQLIIDFYLLLLWFIESLSRFIEHRNCLQLQPLLLSDCLHCLKTSTNLFDSTTHPNIFAESTSVTDLYNLIINFILSIVIIVFALVIIIIVFVLYIFMFVIYYFCIIFCLLLSYLFFIIINFNFN